MNQISLPQQIADDIKDMIVEKKKFQIGDKLPNENILSKELNVSRTTLREAIRILVAQNLLEIKRGKGTFVINDKTDNYNLDNIANTLSDLKDLLELRLIIEPMAVYYATKRASDKEIERIIKYSLLIEEKILNKEERTEYELAFHNAISNASHNKFIKDLMPIINKGINKSIIFSKKYEIINDITIKDHRTIINFIKNRNADGAKVAMELHIINAITIFNI